MLRAWNSPCALGAGGERAHLKPERSGKPAPWPVLHHLALRLAAGLPWWPVAVPCAAGAGAAGGAWEGKRAEVKAAAKWGREKISPQHLLSPGAGPCSAWAAAVRGEGFSSGRVCETGYGQRRSINPAAEGRAVLQEAARMPPTSGKSFSWSSHTARHKKIPPQIRKLRKPSCFPCCSESYLYFSVRHST